MGMEIGIDPGFSGALAVLHSDGRAELYDPPTYKIKHRRKFDEDSMARLIRQIKDHAEECGEHLHATIEWAQAFPREGAIHSFAYGDGFGLWRGMLAMAEIPRQLVRAASWKPKMLAGYGDHGKETSRLVAQQMFPMLDFGNRKDQGRAEALLIAVYGRRLAAGPQEVTE